MGCDDKCSGKYKYHLQKCKKHAPRWTLAKEPKKVKSAKMPKRLLREGTTIKDMKVGDIQSVGLSAIYVDGKGYGWLYPTTTTYPFDEWSDVKLMKTKEGFEVEIYRDFVFDYFEESVSGYSCDYLPIKSIKYKKRDK